nr:flavin reductase [Actinomycetales bacterium]
MTIHSDHPFIPPPHERNQARRLRGRLPAPVTLWTAIGEDGPAAWTVSSLLVADGEPPEVAGLLKESTDLYDAALASRRAAVTLLGEEHRHLADAAAELAPAPGGIWRLAEFAQTEWGPVLAGRSWFGVRIVGTPELIGWNVLARGVIERIEIMDGSARGSDTLGVLRGRYRNWPFE